MDTVGTQVPKTGERRRVARRRVLKSGRILFNHHSCVVDCTIRNLTELGALLIVDSTQGIPETFDLRFEADNSTRVARVIWRADHRLGIEFQ